MKEITNIDDLVPAIRLMARNFVDSTSAGAKTEIFEATPEEMGNLRDTDDLIFQLIIDKVYQKWYLVAVGEADREYQGQIVLMDPMHIRHASLYFSPVDEDWIAYERWRYENAMIQEEPIEFQGDDVGFVGYAGPSR